MIISTTATRPLKFQLKLQDSLSHPGTDIMSFKFTRSDDQQRNQYLNYKAGQYAVVDLGKEDPEGPMRSFTVASSPTEEESILISIRIRDTPFKKKLANLDLGTLVKITAPLGNFVLPLMIYLMGGKYYRKRKVLCKMRKLE